MQKKTNLILTFTLMICLGLWSCGGGVSADDLDAARSSVSQQDPNNDAQTNLSAANNGNNATVIKPNANQTTDAKVSAFDKKTPEAPKVDPDKVTQMAFQETSFDFGAVQEGEKVNHTFKFKNTGDKPLIISDARGSSGCTVPQWPKEPIPPGEEGKIKVEFNSKGKSGKQTKFVTLTANTDPAQTKLSVSSEVIKLKE